MHLIYLFSRSKNMNPKMLNGYQLVEKGFTKIEALPEVGLKDIEPNDTWLEDKHIQSSLETRKHLIGVERIEKRGTLTIATWKKEIMLAEVIQKVGGYWQYMGHNIGKNLYLYPEEALFLMEINSLQLMHNEVKVSLQQAYTLLLHDRMSLLRYKVYASLSRLGYRIFRHKKTDLNVYDKKDDLCPNLEAPKVIPEENISTETEMNINNNDFSKNEKNVPVSLNKSTSENALSSKLQINTTLKNNRILTYNRIKFQKLKNRLTRPCRNNIIQQYFNSIPDLTKKGTIVIKIPDKQYIPQNINITKSTYIINLENVSNKSEEIASTSSGYSVDEEVNGDHIRRLRQTSTSQNSAPHMPNIRINFQNLFQPNYMFQPRPNLFCNFNMLFQRTFLPRWYFGQTLRFTPSNQPFYGNPNPNFIDDNNIYNNFTNYRRKRKRNRPQKCHLDGIKRLAQRLKRLAMVGYMHNHNIHALQGLINTFNARYKTKLILTDDLNILSDETIVDTIDLDDDEELNDKRRKLDVQDQTFDENLNKLKQLALQLKTLENEGNAMPKHKRELAKALKTLNKCYNVDYYINDRHDIINNRHIDLDSSDSDCAIRQEIPKGASKQLKNPFNILKRMSEKLEQTSTDAQASSSHVETVSKNKNCNEVLDTIPKHWLPKQDEFGSVELTGPDDLLDLKQEEFIYDYLKMNPNQFTNWLHLKKSFLQSLKEAMVEFHGISKTLNNDVSSLVKSDNCNDMASILNKLRIIKYDKKIAEECRLTIDFDGYNRDVQNFRKSKPPSPHFRIICLEESSNMPTGEDLETINAAYNDNISIVFAIVGDASVSFLQMKPTDLPIYIASNSPTH